MKAGDEFKYSADEAARRAPAGGAQLPEHLSVPGLELVVLFSQ